MYKTLGIWSTIMTIAAARGAKDEGNPNPDDWAGPATIIEAKSAWRILDLNELYAYRDLFRFLIWRNIKVRYAQSAIGVGWAIIQPLFSMLVFTIVFGNLAKIPSDGAPYAVFTLAALVPWTFFSNSLTEGVDSLVGNANMLRKIYFPRVLLPLASVASKLFDFAIAMSVLAIVMVIYGQTPNWNAIALPLLVVVMVLAAAGGALWLTSLAIQFRDVKHAMAFVVQILMYGAPVVYPVSLIPESHEILGATINPQLFYAINPMVGVIEGFRAALLGSRSMPWPLIAIGASSAVVIFITGSIFFHRKERLFADVA